MYLPLNHATIQLTHLPQNIVAPYQTSRVVIGVENIDVRYFDDGTVPTATTGLLLANGEHFDNPVDLESFDVISVTSANGVNADATINCNATNSDVTFTADEIGIAFNDIEFDLVTSAVNEANATATLNSSNVNSDLVLTAPDVGDTYDGVNFELLTDAVNAVNSSATLNSGNVNSDLIFTAPAAGPEYDGYAFTVNTDAANAVNATLELVVNATANLIWTANAVGDEWNDYVFQMTAADPGEKSAATLNSAGVNSDITFTAPTQGVSYDDTVFETAAAVDGDYSVAVLDSTAVNSDITLTADNKGVVYDGILITVNTDATAGAYATATLSGVNGNCVFQAPNVGDEYNDTVFQTAAGATAVTYNDENSTFTISANGATTWDVIDELFQNLDPNYPQWTAEDGGDVMEVAGNALSVNSAGGIDLQDDMVDYAGGDYTIHVNANATAVGVKALWDAAMTANPGWPQFSCAVEGAGAGEVDDGVNATTASGADPNINVNYDAGTFTLTIWEDNSTSAALKSAFDTAIGANPGWPAWTSAVEGSGAGVVDISLSVNSAGGEDPAVTSVELVGDTFTISVAVDTTATQVAALTFTGFDCTVNGTGTALVANDAGPSNSAGGVDAIAPYIEYAANAFSVHVYPAAIASDVVTLWGATVPGEVAWPQFTVTDEGNGAGEVTDTVTANSAGGVTAIDPYMTFAANEAKIHVYVGATGAVTKTLFDLEMVANPTWQQWTIAVEGNGAGLVTTGVNNESTGGLDQVNAAVTFDAANDIYTISVYADSIGSGVVTLWAAAMAAHPTWPQFTATDEGDGTGIVNTADSTSANGVDGTGALLNIIYYKDSE